MPETPTTPKKSERRKRQRVYGMRFDDAEIAELKRRASAGGFRSPADMVRARCLNGRPLKTRLDVVQLVKLETAINRIGNNINQYAKRANESGLVRPDDIARLTAVLSAIYSRVDGLYPAK